MIVIAIVSISLVAHLTFSQAFVTAVMIGMFVHSRKELTQWGTISGSVKTTLFVYVVHCHIARCKRSILPMPMSYIADPTIVHLNHRWTWPWGENKTAYRATPLGLWPLLFRFLRQSHDSNRRSSDQSWWLLMFRYAVVDHWDKQHPAPSLVWY